MNKQLFAGIASLWFFRGAEQRHLKINMLRFIQLSVGCILIEQPKMHTHDNTEYIHTKGWNYNIVGIFVSFDYYLVNCKVNKWHLGSQYYSAAIGMMMNLYEF